MTPNESTNATEKPTDDSTDQQTTDNDIPLLAAAVTAREMLQDVDPATVDDDQSGRLLNALEALDNIYIEASPDDLAAALGGDGPTSFEPGVLRPRPASECPTVPVYFQIPEAAAARAVDRFTKHASSSESASEALIDLEGYIYDEIDPRHRIYVGDEPLAEYAEDRIDSLTLEPDDENADGTVE